VHVDISEEPSGKKEAVDGTEGTAAAQAKKEKGVAVEGSRKREV